MNAVQHEKRIPAQESICSIQNAIASGHRFKPRTGIAWVSANGARAIAHELLRNNSKRST